MFRIPRNAALLSATLAGCAALFIVAPTAVAGEPPNQNDPCISGVRNTCGTNDVGFYERYTFGIRWFGDYSKAVPGKRHTFCIDLRYWYPDDSYKYKEFPAGAKLKNREGAKVSVLNQRKMAYALWRYGRSENKNRAAATMLYTHKLMGDDAPGEVDPRELGNPRVTAIYNTMKRESERFHGPYRIEVKMPKTQTVGRTTKATVRVLSATGRPVPRVSVKLAATGADGVPARVKTNGRGVGTVTFLPSTAGDFTLRATGTSLPSTLPRLFRPTVRAAARNGQRLATGASQQVSRAVKAKVRPAKVKVTTRARPSRLLVTAATRDTVILEGVPEGWTKPVDVRLYGPFRRRTEITCTGTPFAEETFSGRRGRQRAPVFRPTATGYYTYQLTVPGDKNVLGTTTPCGIPAETIRVEVQPKVTTVVSQERIDRGGTLFDTVKVEGLQNEGAIVTADLWGPYPSREAMTCEGEPFWSGTVAVPGDGEYRTDTVVVPTPGYYTYREKIAKTGFVRKNETECGELTETAIVVGKPAISTKVSRKVVKPGETVTDEVVVTGLGALSATVQVELWGPYPTREAISCVGTAAHTESFTAAGDGTYTTKTVRLNQAGYYTYREYIVGSLETDSVQTECGEVEETTLVRARPRVKTVVSKAAIRPGGRIFDNVRVTGLGSTPATVKLELFGPYASRAAINCRRSPLWTGNVRAKGDGTFRSPSVKLDRAGFYSYRERLIGSPIVQGTKPRCAAVSETTLARPLILTGRGEPATTDHAKRFTKTAVGPRPTRVAIPGLNISAPVTSVGIDLRLGALAVPAPIRKTGWWKDGAAPGDKSGTVLIAGHTDSARGGPGAFFRLRNARRNQVVEVRSATGKTTRYRVRSSRRYIKAKLPTGLYTNRGRPRLVLVTCGGPFIRSEGFYRDNVVVVATPV